MTGVFNSPIPRKKSSKTFRQKIRRALDGPRAMEKDPFQGDIKRLQGQSTGWRRRVGSYRIITTYISEQRLIVIAGIVRRTSNDLLEPDPPY